MDVQTSPQGNLLDILRQHMANQQQDNAPTFTAQALQQRFQPTMTDTSNSIYNTAQSFLNPNFKPATPDMEAQTRATNELTPYTAMLGLQKAQREVNAPYSDYGKITDDLNRGLITPELANQAFAKGDVDQQLKQAQINYYNAKTNQTSGNNDWSTGNPALDKAVAGQDAKTLESYTNAADTASSLADKATQFQALHSQMRATGPFFGHLPSTTDAAQTADALNTDMATALTSLQKGSQSDKELGLALRSVPSGLMSEGAVALSVKKYNAARAVLQTKQSFMDQYIQAHGNLRGAEAKWNQFRSQNPILDGSQQNIRDGIEEIYNPAQDFSSIIGGKLTQTQQHVTDVDEDSILQELQRRGVQ